MKGKSGYLRCFYIKSTVQNKKLKSLQLHLEKEHCGWKKTWFYCPVVGYITYLCK